MNTTAQLGNRKIEVRMIEQTGVDVCLDRWRWWMGKDDRDLGIKSGRVDGDGTGNSSTYQVRRDVEIAEATDAMIGGLKMIHRWAIMKKLGLSGVWRYPYADLAVTYSEAIEALEPRLRQNSATRLLF